MGDNAIINDSIHITATKEAIQWSATVEPEGAVLLSETSGMTPSTISLSIPLQGLPPDIYHFSIKIKPVGMITNWIEIPVTIYHNHKGLSTIRLEASPSPSTVLQPVELKAYVDVVPPSIHVPSGRVTFRIDGVDHTLGLLPDGTAVFRTSELTWANHTIIATYEGDENFEGSTSSEIVHFVNPLRNFLPRIEKR